MEPQTITNVCQETLQYDQVLKLNDAYQMPLEVHGRGHFPTLEVRLQDIVQKVHGKLEENGIKINDVRVNGGMANYIVGDAANNPLIYNDIDLIFSVAIDSEEQLLSIKDYVMECLLQYFPSGINRERLSMAALTDAYVSKLAKVWHANGDKWTLVTLSNDDGMNLELKFVHTMKRKYQFSVDSFQIILDSLMQFYELSSDKMTKDFYPTIVVESVWGCYQDAIHHLNNRLICTRAPQEIRGGGLLKYCDLLARGYIPACDISETETLERLMCSRFFIDYSDSMSQFQKLNSYLVNHFNKNFALMLCYLDKLYGVVNSSTVCLMSHERRQALDLILSVAGNIRYELDAQYHLQYDGWQEDKLSPMYSDYSHPMYHPIQQAVAICSGFPPVQHVC